MTAGNHVPIPGTHRNPWLGTTAVAEAVSDADVWLTAWLRPQHGGELDAARARTLGATLPAQRAYAERAELEAQTTADPKDVALLQTYCAKFGVEIVRTHWRSVVLSGRTHKLIEAFGATAAMHQTSESPPRRFRHRSESLYAPPEIAAILRGVFGIHQWPRSRPVGSVHSSITPLSAQDVASRYEFPSADGSGEIVGILQMRGTFKPDDFTKCMQDQGVATKLPSIKRVDDAELVHGIVTDKDLESATDTQIIGALAPGAQIVIYAAPDDERGVLDAIRTALFPKDGELRPSILSVSFGFPEQLWTPVALTILDELFTVAALLGVSIFCASGDHGAETNYDGQPHVLAPASSPFAHACGGTDITSGAEIAWNETGGGFSDRDDNPVPPWQSAVASVAGGYQATPRRGVPDFAAQVLPGYSVFVEGTKLPMSGTSTIAPMWAALAARLNQQIGRPIGFFAPLLYGAPAGTLFRDVTSGGNDRFRAQAGWNPCTGLGVPIGSAIENALRAAGS